MNAGRGFDGRPLAGSGSPAGLWRGRSTAPPRRRQRRRRRSERAYPSFHPHYGTCFETPSKSGRRAASDPTRRIAQVGKQAPPTRAAPSLMRALRGCARAPPVATWTTLPPTQRVLFERRSGVAFARRLTISPAGMQPRPWSSLTGTAGSPISVLSTTRPRPASRTSRPPRIYVAAALDEIGAGKPVTVVATRAYGCSIKYRGLNRSPLTGAELDGHRSSSPCLRAAREEP
jgi:hypothetical protein